MAEFSWKLFEDAPIVGIIRGIDAAVVQPIAEQYASGGLTTLEITMNTPGAEDIIYHLKNHMAGSLNVGAGTVCTLDELDLAINAGASFIVTPVINEDVISKCVANKIPIFPGAYTPSEIYKAWSMGASMVKVFPASRLGPDYIREVLAPLNKVKLMPTGGVSLDNCEAFFKAGAKGVGMGSNLFPKDLIASGSWPKLRTLYYEYASVIKRIVQNK
jgi:2-dehydro-3-deoxyphosphogluconate aldolase/(4S)-4-hydroxy-2-oxoglutarate aldolase